MLANRTRSCIAKSDTRQVDRSDLLSLSLTAWKSADDWHEFAVQLEHRRSGLRWVTADVSVACQCETDHNAHYLRSWEWLVGTSDAVVLALEDAAQVATQWFRTPRDAPAKRYSSSRGDP